MMHLYGDIVSNGIYLIVGAVGWILWGRERIDAWIIWFLNDVCYVIEYLLLPDQALYLMALNVLWTVMAVLSYINWKRIMTKEVSI